MELCANETLQKQLAEIVLEMGLVNQAQLNQAYTHQNSLRIPLAQAMQDLGLLDEIALAKAQAKQFDLPFIDLSRCTLSKKIISLVPSTTAKEFGVIPVAQQQGKLIVAIADPLQAFVADQLEFILGMEVQCGLAAAKAHQQAFQQCYAGKSNLEVIPQPNKKSAAKGDDDAPIIRLVEQMVTQAVKARASDIHIEPFKNHVRVRYRVDGILQSEQNYSQHLQSSLISRLKIMASLDIAEKRRPQDGRIGIKIQDKDIDIRVSVLPSQHGETLVLRLLDRDHSLRSLRDLGMSETVYSWFRQIIQRPNGIVLVTGPTGSGKTTTLYAALQSLNRPNVKIITAEDPIEYNLKGINQVQVKPQIDLSFARILRAMLRQAPNIILVGEIRDRETAVIAIQAALTGHLVFSTLHTNDAPSAITRLIDMGAKPFLVAASLQAVLSQRLVRRLCTHCKQAYIPPPSELQTIGLSPAQIAGKSIFRPKGCPRCGGSGYRGRQGVFEKFELDSILRDMIYKNVPSIQLREQARLTGRFSSLLEDGIEKILRGETTIAEVLRVNYVDTHVEIKEYETW